MDPLRVPTEGLRAAEEHRARLDREALVREVAKEQTTRWAELLKRLR